MAMKIPKIVWAMAHVDEAYLEEAMDRGDPLLAALGGAGGLPGVGHWPDGGPLAQSIAAAGTSVPDHFQKSGRVRL